MSGAGHELVREAEKAVGDAVFDLLCDCKPNDDDACDDGCQANENYAGIGPAVLAALRSLPIDQRMEAMGMELVGDTYEGQDEYKRPVFLPSWRERRDGH